LKKYVKAYVDYHGFTVGDFIPCEECGAEAADIHHVDKKGMGGKKHNPDNPKKLKALCREHHAKAHGINIVT